VPWIEVLGVFVVCHLSGDYLLQTEWQALHKRGGLSGDPIARSALLRHVTTYTVAFVPALVWLADRLGAAVLGIGAVIALPHLIQDDGRLLLAYIRRIKGLGAAENPSVVAAADQSFHVLALFLTALLAAA
jgi:hypothetical protein